MRKLCLPIFIFLMVVPAHFFAMEVNPLEERKTQFLGDLKANTENLLPFPWRYAGKLILDKDEIERIDLKKKLMKDLSKNIEYCNSPEDLAKTTYKFFQDYFRLDDDGDFELAFQRSCYNVILKSDPSVITGDIGSQTCRCCHYPRPSDEMQTCTKCQNSICKKCSSTVKLCSHCRAKINLK